MFRGIWGLSANSIFSSILYLSLDSGVSFKVFVCAWIGIVYVVCLDILVWVVTVYAGFCQCVSVVSIQQDCFLGDLDDFGGVLIF